MYYDLQQKTVPLAQDLQTYSNAQLALLPKLVSTTSAKPGEVTVATYLSANKAITVDYKTKADEIFKDRLGLFSLRFILFVSSNILICTVLHTRRNGTTLSTL